MDPRQSLLDLLESFVPYDSRENESLQQVKDFVLAHADCFGHSVLPGHVTGSAFVVDRDYAYTLLTHHKKMNMWLQFGGHSDDHPIVSETAMREAREESGLDDIRYSILGNIIDVRFLYTANRQETLTVSPESNDLAWIRLSDAADYNARPEFMRMAGKVLRLRNSGILSFRNDYTS